MKTKGFLILFLVFFTIQSCIKKTAAEFNSDPSIFKEYISGFTSGIIPSKSDIRVVFAFNKGDWKPNQVLDNDLFDISPSIDGKVVALSANTIAFIPEKRLKNNTEYQITLKLSKVLKVPEKLAEFHFTARTIKQDFVVTTEAIQSYNKEFQYLNVMLKSADELTSAQAAKLISASQKGKKLKIKIDKDRSTPTDFKFIIDSIARFPEDSKIEISYNGTKSGIDQKGGLQYDIAGRDHFKVANIRVADGDNQTLLINFSDPVDKLQNFSGLVSVESAGNITYSTEGNVLKAFFDQPLNGSLLVEVFQGILNDEGRKLKETYSEKVAFAQMPPAVRFIKSGTILPGSANLKINFEAVNLKAVDVKIYKIYKNNILQFLQDNELNGSRNLRRVAQPIAKQKLILKNGNLLNYGKWNSFALDLSKVITPEPGAVYRVEIAFKKEYSLFECDASITDQTASDEEETDEDDVNYSGGNDYDDYYYEDNYDWRERENPCSSSYYYDVKVGTNVLATDLGVIAKRGENKSYFIAVNNILTTDPVEGATVALYSYQQQKIAEAKTCSDGTITFNLKKFAYFAIVAKGKNSTYVKLDDGLALSVSNFDVAGETLQKGLKGYIYGERGVWRPGDDLHLGFMLNDAANKLPPAHPIKITLTDPNGKQRYQSVIKSAEINHYAFTIPTSQDDPTGSWEAMVTVGGARFYKNIKIETIKPNRLKIRNSFTKPLLSAVTPNVANLSVTWLHGAVAKNLKVDMQAKFSQQPTTFRNYDKYVFDDAVRKFGTEELPIFSGKLDANGNASLTISPKLNVQSPGMLKAAFITKVYEEGGDFSTDVMTATYSPYQTYIGLKTPDPNKYGMLETRKVNRFDFVSVNENGGPVGGKTIDVKVYKVSWRWWWDASNDNLSDFNSSNVTTAFKNYQVKTDASGRANVQFSVTDDEWGRYLIRASDPDGGHAVSQTVLIDWPSWSGKTRNTDASQANMLVFSTDKKEYATGEKALVSFPSSDGGRALISVENGSRVVQTFWAETKAGETTVSIPITPAMAPNVYFNITLLQPHANTINDSPIRMYGVVPISVVDKNTILKPKITMPETLRPEKEFTVKVSEASGREMTYTIAVVDDGLLDLTRFKTPNAWDSFYTREALGVRTWDVYDDIIGAYGGQVNQIFSIGGDQDLGGGNAKKANRFKPVVIYLGPFKLEKGQTKSHILKLPKYVGSVRTMIVAGNANSSAYGCAEKTTPVKSPLMVLASLPRKISPAEKVTVPVTIFAMEKHVKNVNVQIKTSNGLKVVGASSQNLTFTQPDEKMAYFNLEVGSITGIGKIQIIATSGNERASYDVEIDMTNPNPVTTNFKDIVLKPNSSATISWDSFGVAGTNKATLEVSSMPAIDLNGRLQYLISYPHGCVEQTTSAVFPQLFLTDVADIDAARQKSVQKNITAGINALAGFQLANGGFAYWPGNKISDDWGTSYAGHFLVEAEKKGYVLPPGFKSKWLTFQKNEARQWRFLPQYSNDLAQAYRLYTLALAGSSDLASMNRLRETTGISNETKLRLAAAYAVAGQKSAALALYSKSTIDGSYEDNYSDYYYGSPERNLAMALETMLLLMQQQKAFTLANRLAKQLASPEWMSTQTTAYSLYAMALFATNNGPKGIDLQFSKDGKSEMIKTDKAIANRNLTVKNGSNGISIRNNRNNTLYVRVLSSGILPVGDEQVLQNNLLASIVYKDRKGAMINVSTIKQATEFVAEITIRNKQNELVRNVALTQLLPSGFEIVNTRFTDYGDATANVADYIDIRDDRTNFYFSLKPNESKTFRVLLNASYLGTYYLPGLQCEAMYDHSFLARTKGQWIRVLN